MKKPIEIGTDGGIIWNMTNTNYAWYRSGAVWSIIIMFLIGGFQNISSMIPGGQGIIGLVLAVLGAFAVYLHISQAKALGATN